MSILKQFGCCLPLKCNNPSPWSTPRSSFRSPRDDDPEGEFDDTRRQLNFGGPETEELRATLLAALPVQGPGQYPRGNAAPPAPAPASGSKEKKAESGAPGPEEPPLPPPWPAGGGAAAPTSPPKAAAEGDAAGLTMSRRTIVEEVEADPAHMDKGVCACSGCKSVRRVQAQYRGHKLRRELSGRSLVPGQWQELIKQMNRDAVRKFAASADRSSTPFAGAHAKRHHEPSPVPSGTAASGFVARRRHSDQWRMAKMICSEIGEGTLDTEDKTLLLETEHWLELTDVKHRYGANLCPYFLAWRASNTTQNFFVWLDSGEGAALDIPERPRATLEAERVMYCTEAVRAQYEVGVEDGTGRLVFMQDRRPLHTLAGDGPVELEDDMANTEEAKRKRNENKWIYVVSPGFRMYVAKKVRGRFHHSSFLAGGSVLAAGSLTAQDGRILKLTAFSGHYKPKPEDFRRFVDRLRALGVPLEQAKLKESKDPARLAEKAAAKAAKKKAAEGGAAADGEPAPAEAAPAPAAEAAPSQPAPADASSPVKAESGPAPPSPALGPIQSSPAPQASPAPAPAEAAKGPPPPSPPAAEAATLATTAEAAEAAAAAAAAAEGPDASPAGSKKKGKKKK